MNTNLKLSDADTRRASIIAAALSVFAQSGYGSTPVAAVAAKAGISQAYVFKLYPTKEVLFVAAMERCYEIILETLASAADAATDPSPEGILEAMGEAYARLIVDRDILMIQVHAQSAADIPAVKAVVRRGLAKFVRLAKSRSSASDTAVQSFIAYGQLCHLIVTTDLTELTDDWAQTLWKGMSHY
ncbi:TetR/AcrR family transcriptional regulator [Devosia sp.]|uniref:TetR/AcrR family transcriptional regulator n=1 Tax=Devosia sp. TaxID=1871048 RepID=UPI002FC6EA49